MGNDNASLGNASLWTSIGGIVLPGTLVVLVAVFLNRPVLGQDPGPAYVVCGLLFVLLELIALGCGISTRNVWARIDETTPSHLYCVGYTAWGTLRGHVRFCSWTGDLHGHAV